MENVTERKVRKTKTKANEAIKAVTMRRTKASKNRIRMNDAPTETVDTSEFSLRKCSVVLKRLPPEILGSPLRRFNQNKNEEKVYDFNESQSQDDVDDQEMADIYKKLEEKNIAKVAKHKSKIQKAKGAKGTTVMAAKESPKKRKGRVPATKTATKSTTAATKKNVHNLNVGKRATANEKGANKAAAGDVIVVDNDSEGLPQGACAEILIEDSNEIGETAIASEIGANIVATNSGGAIQGVCTEILDQDGNPVGLIECALSPKPLRPPRPQRNLLARVAAENIRKNKETLANSDAIESFGKQQAAQKSTEDSPFITSPISHQPDWQDDSWAPESAFEPLPSSRVVTRRGAKKAMQSTPLAQRTFVTPSLNRSELFGNASPLARNSTPIRAAFENIEEADCVDLVSNDGDFDFGINERDAGAATSTTTTKDKPRVYGRSPLKNITNDAKKGSPLVLSSPDLFNDLATNKKSVPEVNKTVMLNPMTFAKPKKDVVNVYENRPIVDPNPIAQCVDNLFGFDEDIDTEDVTIVGVSVLGASKNALEEKRNNLRRYLKNPEPKCSASPKKRKMPTKAGKPPPTVIFNENNNVQKDIRTAFTTHKQSEPIDDGLNLFSDTETERSQDRRKSYSRPVRQYKRPTIVESEPEDQDENEDDDDDEGEQTKKKKRAKRQPRKKLLQPKAKADDHDEELDKFAKEFNSMCEEIESYEVPVEPDTSA